MRISKTIIFIIAILAIITLLSGCNTSNQPTETEGTEPPAETEKITNNNSSSTNTKLPNYDKEIPQNPADLPKYNNKDFDYTDIYLGQESEMHVVEKADEAGYQKYLSDLEAYGYDFYAENAIGDNLYATYINDTHIINVMYIPAFSQVRIIADDRSIFDLPGLEADNVYEDIGTGALIMLSDDEITWPGRMGYVYQLADGSFFVIDGGWGDNNPTLSTAPTLMATLQEYAPDPDNIKVAAWLISHQHTDHVGAMYDISRNEEYRSKITVEKIIYSMPSQQSLSTQDRENRYDSGMVESGKKTATAIENLKPEQVIKAHPGQIFYIRDLTLTVYHSHDLLLYAPSTNTTILNRMITKHNDTSLVTKVNYKGKSALFLADCSYIANTNVLDPVYGPALDADIVQVAHHGYGDTGADNIYKHMSPSMVFWPVYRYHYYPSTTYSGGVSSISMNKSLFKEGIKHYVLENDLCLVIDNFETWESREWDALPNDQ